MAAICFYKALKVYPAPAELVMVYQKTIPPEVFTLVMGMLSMDVGCPIQMPCSQGKRIKCIIRPT